MELQEYKQKIATTWNTVTNQKVHVHLLLKSEIGELESAYKKLYGYGRELDVKNVIEETGDLCYGLFTWSRLNDIDAEIPDSFTTEETIFEDSVCDIMDALTMSSIILLKTDKDNYLSVWNSIWSILEGVCYDTNLTWEQIMDANIEKLTERYPTLKFNSEHSEIRLDKQ